MCALADDSGLEVEALAGAPGSSQRATPARMLPTPIVAHCFLPSSLRHPNTSRRARFVAAVAIADAKGSVLNVSEGICEGKIIFSPRGDGGFGYDPLFVPDGYNQTFAELAEEVKNRISHRARALMKIAISSYSRKSR